MELKFKIFLKKKNVIKTNNKHWKNLHRHPQNQNHSNKPNQTQFN